MIRPVSHDLEARLARALAVSDSRAPESVAPTDGRPMEGICAEILTGDCLEVLSSMPDRMWDHVITDPPWKGEIKTKRGRQAVALDYAPGGHITEAWAQAIAARCRRWAVVFCAVAETHEWRAALQDAGMRYVREIWWIKTNRTPQLTGDRPGAPGEAAIVCHAAGHRLRWNGGGRAGLYVTAREPDGGEWHSSPKSRTLCEALVRDFTDPGDSILDLWAGSGAIGKAALRLGRSYTGIEIRDDWAERARSDLARVRQNEFDAVGRPRQNRLNF